MQTAINLSKCGTYHILGNCSSSKIRTDYMWQTLTTI